MSVSGMVYLDNIRAELDRTYLYKMPRGIMFGYSFIFLISISFFYNKFSTFRRLGYLYDGQYISLCSTNSLKISS